MDAKIISKSDLPEFDFITTKQFEIGYYAQKSPLKKTLNEDALGFVTHNKQVVLALADGVGGSPNGDEASSTTITAIVNHFKKADSLPKNLSVLREKLISTIETVNQTLLHNFVGAQTTLSLCLISDNELQSIQVGDSSTLICGQKGLLKFKSTEHSPTGLLLTAGVLTEKEALAHPDRHIVSNVVGDKEMHLDIGPHIELAPHDTVLIASDGIFDNFTSDELIELIRKDSTEEVTKKLTDLCQLMREEEKQDNFNKIDDISFIVCRHTK